MCTRLVVTCIGASSYSLLGLLIVDCVYTLVVVCSSAPSYDAIQQILAAFGTVL